MAKLREDSYNMPDSAFEQSISKKFFLRPDSLNITKMDYLSDTSSEEAMRLNLPHTFVYADSILPNGRIEYTTTLPVKKYAVLNDFICKYPAFGLWLCVLIIQAPLYVVFCFFLVLWFMQQGNKSEDGWLTPRFFLRSAIFISVLLIASVFLGVFYGADDVYVREIFFIRDVHERMSFVNAIGYSAASLCLAGMLWCAYRMRMISKTAKPEEIKQDSMQESLLQIRKTFNILFLLVAVILSLAVFSTGVLYSGLNSLDYVKQLNKAMGYQVYRYDLVYMYGILHSFILLIVYLPSKAIVDSVPVQAADESTGNNKLSSTIIKKTFEVLVASSPLIAGFLQAMLDHIFG
ncbi:hypothetical protein [Sediminibacterium ginsengisoli]|nr:hypothetical protein [Sediminibacterium ginsengisoli]